MHVRAFAVAQNPYLQIHGRGQLHWESDISAEQRAAITHQGDEEALQEFSADSVDALNCSIKLVSNDHVTPRALLVARKLGNPELARPRDVFQPQTRIGSVGLTHATWNLPCRCTVAQGWCRLFGCASHLVALSNNAFASCCLRYGSNRIKQQSLRCLFAACLCWRVWRFRLVYERGNNYIYNNIKRLCDIVQPAETFLLPWFADVDVAVECLPRLLVEKTKECAHIRPAIFAWKMRVAVHILFAVCEGCTYVFMCTHSDVRRKDSGVIKFTFLVFSEQYLDVGVMKIECWATSRICILTIFQFQVVQQCGALQSFKIIWIIC